MAAVVLAGCSASSSTGGTSDSGILISGDSSTVGTGSLPAAEASMLTGSLPAGTAASSKGEGTAPADAVSFTGTFPKAMSGFGTTTLTVGGVARTVGFYVPSTLPSHPAVVLAFHGTGGNPRDFLDESAFAAVADSNGFVVVLPQAIANRRGGAGDPDHFVDQEYATGWNLSEPAVDANDDVLLVRAAIQAARTAWSINTDRVYATGHSNGAFFSWFLASVLNTRIAAFSENSGGAIRCANRGDDGAGNQFTGTGLTCAALKLAAGFPPCMGTMRPTVPASGAIRLGYLAHHNDDDVVSVAWTCTLAEAMGARGVVRIFSSNTDSNGHSVTRGFAETSWSFLSRYTRAD